MRTQFYLDGKKITKKALTEMIGKERLDGLVKSAKEVFFQDPLIELDYWIGYGMLTIRFV